jgi:capsid protein
MILDQYGQPAPVRRHKKWETSRLIEGAQNPGHLPQWMYSYGAIDKEVSATEWRQLVAASRKLYANLGPAKGAISDKAMYSVGRAWQPEFRGQDTAWGQRATEWLSQEWYGVADARGPNYDFVTVLFLLSISVDRDGDVAILLTEQTDGYPAIQVIPAHRIGSRSYDTEVKGGRYNGLPIRNGVIFNRSGRPVAYRLLGDSEKTDRDVSARDVIHIFEPEWYDQARGFPGFTHAINDLRSLMTTQGYEEKAAMLASELGLVEHNMTGMPNPEDPEFALTASDVQPAQGATGLTTQTLAGGAYRYFQAGTGSKIEIVKNDRPGQSWESFMDRLIRNAMVGLGWPYEMAWDVSKLGGANTRLCVAKAMRSVEDRQDLLRPVAKRCVGYAIAKAINLGVLPQSDDWWKWDFSLPPRLTVDFGRDSNADRADYEAGIRTLTDILAEQGIKLEDHVEKLRAERELLSTLQPSAAAEPQA